MYASELVAGAGFVALHGGEDCILAKLDSSVIMEELCVYILVSGHFSVYYEQRLIHRESGLDTPHTSSRIRFRPSTAVEGNHR